MISEAFQQYVAEVVEKHFKDAPAPDGKTATNQDHANLKDAACDEINNYIALQAGDEQEKREMTRYAEDRAQSAIYALFPKITRKPKRYR